MTRRPQLFNRASWMLLAGFAALLALLPSQMFGQSSGPQVDTCTLATVDYGNDVEQELCFWGDQSQVYATADTDSFAYSDSQNFPSGNPNVIGVGAQGQVYNGNSGSLVADTGMQYGQIFQWDGLPDGLYPAGTSTSITPQLNVAYTLYGLYAECYDPTGGGQSCSWTSAAYGGNAVVVTVTGGTNSPTLSLGTSNSSTIYGQPVAFTASISSGPTGSLIFYDGTAEIGTAAINGTTSIFTTNALAGGTHSITAVWPGNSSYGTIKSNTITQSINSVFYSYCIPGPSNANCTSTNSGYAPNGNVIAYTDSVNGTWNLGYDALNRLASATASPAIGGNSSFNWTYDSFGNRLSQTGNGGMNIVTQSGNDASGIPHNQVTSTNARGVSWVAPPSYYDAAGNIQSDGANQYLYDSEGHVCAVAPIGGGAWMQYIYDATGTRVGKGTISNFSCDTTTNGFTLTAQYILGPSGEQMTEIAYNGGTPTWKHTNVYTDGAVATYLNDGAGPHFRLTDWVGTTRVQTNSAGTPELYCQSLPFGDTTAQCVSANEQFFTGYERDIESGNDYAQARYYANSMGRFMSPDPSGLLAQNPADPQSWNLYAYARNNPLSNIDPTGLDCVYANDAGTGVDTDANGNVTGIDHNSNADECGQNGGTWAPGYVDQNWVHFNNNTNMFQVGSVDGGGNGATVDYTNFASGAQTDANGNCLSGCGGYGFSSANANWLQGQLVGNSNFSGLDGYIQFLVGREQPLSTFSQIAFGPIDYQDNHWAGPGGFGPPGGEGDWKASVHDYNFGTNGITIGSYFNPFLSPATSRALIQSNNYLMQTGGFQGAKEKLFFGVVNAFQWATHIF